MKITNHKQKHILVLGGAGYIGSACVDALCNMNAKVTVVDNLSHGEKKYVHPKAIFIKTDLLGRKAINKIMAEETYDSVLHFAAHKDTGSSMKNATKYAENLRGMINILDAMVANKIPQIIFSSSATVYGTPVYSPMDEKHPIKPINFYGYTKLAGEQLIDWYSKIHNFNYVSLRYFNAAGDYGLKYIDKYSKNLFPAIVKVLTGKSAYLEIYGNNYKTRDGTCIRDYIHISDLVSGHLAALNYKPSDIFNLGTSHGQTVKEVIAEFEKQIGRALPKKIVAPRPGDSMSLVADCTYAHHKLGWQAIYDLPKIVSSTLKTII
ncbi:MAG: UDP-glucose 4-epimerase, UDP-glucose 4-epimerase [Candidatus Peregrinibacteria bacterium GW2011_GWF2_33_10]|nr:MAG: UDP-glucose 4-epimerase, UDP-glucose 4-epimerase [Candidatus Peregrinibacteria bacterium GW2011_GWF2_33_10]OGJ44848.1 MAG: UDP-glucose 4-epimerase GalE [Candidatus Peregrinibacteria bacterium RIFOXYA2_FULL_33_21]OGJ47133.1 MAG: UDP-glucose 4-epimerase GalE [Candidatus Peregrinibacteria bacterium RIFOXYA12_FULL_33_12]OGJ50534.1 MAG: UDP-glucose 4-epimerase GalE [Candidatus Peregrinibacteria bacterium RIFOXYB2_FULL_33_20]